MGVPGYFACARRICPSAVVGPRARDPSVVPPFSRLFVDFNCLVHRAVDVSANAGEFDDASVLARAVLELEQVVDDCGPTAGVHVCADGVPPEAKMAQQRSRRFLACKRGQGADSFDRNKITPGTEFNAALDGRMRDECARLAMERGIAVSYSGTDCPGEGEQKIMAILRGAPDDGDACVYGLDADLVLLCACLCAQGRRGPWLCREEDASGGGLTYVNAERIACGMAGGRTPRALWNHVVCSFLCGNDFLPPLSCLSVSRESAWLPRLRAMCDSGNLSLVTPCGESLSWPDMRRLLNAMSESEDEDFAKADALYWSAPRPVVFSPEEAWDNYPVLRRREGLRAIRPGEPDWRSRYYALLFGMRGAGGVNRVVGEYLRGVRWTFDYYRGAFPPPDQPPAWYYRHAYGPTSLDLHNWLALDKGEPDCADLSGLDRSPVDASLLLRFVTPESSSSILPDSMRDRRPAHLFPTDCPIACYLKRKIWECRAELPPGRSSDVVVTPP
jgi:5'-3' exonuclease